MAKMTPEKAVEVFQKYYEKALRNEYVQKKVAWALYQAWEEVDAKEKPNNTKHEMPQIEESEVMKCAGIGVVVNPADTSMLITVKAQKIACGDPDKVYQEVMDALNRVVNAGQERLNSLQAAKLMGPWSYYVPQQTTEIQETSFLCRSTGKPCQNATDLGYCIITVCTNREDLNRRPV